MATDEDKQNFWRKDGAEGKINRVPRSKGRKTRHIKGLTLNKNSGYVFKGLFFFFFFIFPLLPRTLVQRETVVASIESSTDANRPK